MIPTTSSLYAGLFGQASFDFTTLGAVTAQAHKGWLVNHTVDKVTEENKPLMLMGAKLGTAYNMLREVGPVFGVVTTPAVTVMGSFRYVVILSRLFDIEKQLTEIENEEGTNRARVVWDRHRDSLLSLNLDHPQPSTPDPWLPIKSWVFYLQDQWWDFWSELSSILSRGATYTEVGLLTYDIKCLLEGNSDSMLHAFTNFHYHWQNCQQKGEEKVNQGLQYLSKQQGLALTGIQQISFKLFAQQLPEQLKKTQDPDEVAEGLFPSSK